LPNYVAVQHLYHLGWCQRILSSLICHPQSHLNTIPIIKISTRAVILLNTHLQTCCISSYKPGSRAVVVTTGSSVSVVVSLWTDLHSPHSDTCTLEWEKKSHIFSHSTQGYVTFSHSISGHTSLTYLICVDRTLIRVEIES
jgi:hypothetical protein